MMFLWLYRFSALSKPEDEGRSRYGVSPARDGGRGGRGFGRPVRISQRASQEQEKESALAAARYIPLIFKLVSVMNKSYPCQNWNGDQLLSETY